MIELLVLIAIAYAGARGVESVAATGDRRQRSKDAELTVAEVAASGPKGASTGKKTPGPTEPGGTFSKAAPRSAVAGGKVAVPLAVLTETGSTMWKAVGEGYRERWPEIRAERRHKMAERAARRKVEKEAAEADAKAKAAAAKAGPPPLFPPKPAEAPIVDAEATATAPDGADTGDGSADVPAQPTAADKDRADAAEDRADAAERKAEAARKDAEAARSTAATDKVLAAQKEAREAKEREAEANERARTAEARAPQPTERPHLTVVPTSKTGVDMASSPHTLIPEIRTLDGLLNALALVRAMAEMRADEAAAIAGDDMALSNRLDEIEAGLSADEVDDATLAQVAELRESIANQSRAAAQYSGTAKDSADMAQAVAESAKKSHGGIAEAIQSAPIEKAAQAGYYNR